MQAAGVLFLVGLVLSLWLAGLIWPLVIAAVIIKWFSRNVNSKPQTYEAEEPGHVVGETPTNRPKKFHKKKFKKRTEPSPQLTDSETVRFKKVGHSFSSTKPQHQ